MALKITQTKSLIGRLQNQRRTIKALGLKGIGSSVVHEDRPEIRGMVKTVDHMITVEEMTASAPESHPRNDSGSRAKPKREKASGSK